MKRRKKKEEQVSEQVQEEQAPVEGETPEVERKEIATAFLVAVDLDGNPSIHHVADVDFLNVTVQRVSTLRDVRVACHLILDDFAGQTAGQYAFGALAELLTPKQDSPVDRVRSALAERQG